MAEETGENSTLSSVYEIKNAINKRSKIVPKYVLFKYCKYFKIPAFYGSDLTTDAFFRLSSFLVWSVSDGDRIFTRGWGSPLYGLYRCVRPQKVWFFSRFGHKHGIDFGHFGLKRGMVFAL